MDKLELGGMEYTADTARLDALKAKLKARQGKPAFRENVRYLETEIARLEGKA